MDIYEDLAYSKEDLQNIAKSGKDWAITHGCLMKNAHDINLAQHANFMLFPTPFPSYLYKEALEVQKDFQLLYHKASLDHEFIKDSLKSVIVHDEFTRKLYELYSKARIDGSKPKLYFPITRSDYMLDDNKEGETERKYELRQIEMNMISVGCIAISPLVGRLHQYLSDEWGERSLYKKHQVPLTETYVRLGVAMSKAFQVYGNENAIVLFIIENIEMNRIDQRHLQYTFQKGVKDLGINKFVPCLFRTLQEVHDHGKLGEGNKLLYDGKDVAICYFRAGYSPTNYNTDERWKARLMIERSCCIKSPTIGEQLVGTKKIQQVMAKPGMVEKFIKDENAVKRIRRTFAGLFSLDPGQDGDEAAKKALDEPSRYVLKPQREGGGNNLYDDELVEELKRVNDHPLIRSQYILMERIRPPVVKNYIVRYNSNTPSLTSTISELGIMGFLLSDGETIYENESAGHLYKTKSVEYSDSGILSGRAIIDTPGLLF